MGRWFTDLESQGYKLNIKNTIEERILEMQNQKKKLADDIISGENISSTTLTREDLMMLLSRSRLLNTLKIQSVKPAIV